MNENNNYFGDITELFLKAKKEENIDVNPQSKNAIREMVLHKINSAPAVSTWQKWRYQIVGVPASLMALVVIVYAATNLDFSLPKEDFTPEVFDSVLQSENIAVEEETVEEEVLEPGESDNAFLWVMPADKTDPKELREPRTLNKIVPKTVKEEPIYTTPSPVTEPTLAEKDSNLDLSTLTDTMNLVLPDEEEKNESATEPVADQPVQDTTPSDPIAQPKPSNKSVQPNGKPQTESINENALISPVTTTDMLSAKTTHQEQLSLREEYAEQENIFKKQEITNAYTTYYYSDIELNKMPDFGDELLAKITSSGEPNAVTVYYITDTKVVIDVVYGNASKWYLFVKIEDQWTIEKYEKELLKGVVK